MMKAVSIKGKELVSIDELATPKLKDGDVLVRMRACGLCGSDLEKVYGQYGMSSAKLGHEPSGEIMNVGNSVKDFSPGDRVFIHHHVACYSCYYCRHGDYTMCNMYQKSNIQPCGLSQQIVVPKWNISRGGLLRLPNNMSFDEASLIEPLACCIRSLNKCNFQKGDDVAIFGAGPAGMMHVALANIFGAGKIIVIDINNFRINFAKKFCYNVSTLNSLSDKEDLTHKIKNITDGRGVDISIVATGSTKALAQAFETTRKAGKIMLFGVPSKNSNISLNMNKLYSREQSFFSCYAASEVETNQALKILAEKRLDIKRLITHRFSIENADKAIKCAHEAKDAMKVIVTSN
ncbi:MAG TPA: zinc-dependent dehydrogenase [Nitrososphaeraceae archaeon]|jgi:L-iditol 2-dehydrogenase|nr:zinc-dependent dehydrogenase [Nitrososphaeraceae archaeon]